MPTEIPEGATLLEGEASKQELVQKSAHASQQSITQISSVAELDQLKFWEQGDDSMYTVAAM